MGVAIPAIASAQVDCPSTTLRVDNDRPGSGYSEVRPENWESRNVNACAGTYRYLSRLIGDGSRRGAAVWQPTVPRDGWYRVELSYRATENRSSAARYIISGDDGAERTHVEDQRNGDACVRRDVGEVFCRVGGTCRLTLDSQDGQSASADETVFTLIRCGDAPAPPEPPPPGACAGIAATPGFEVCEAAETRCAGVFSNGAGCAAFCAAAGMVCVARSGGEPGCMEEPQSPVPCDTDNGHASDWCVCERPDPPPPAPVDAGPPAPMMDAATEDTGAADARSTSNDAARPQTSDAALDDAAAAPDAQGDDAAARGDASAADPADSPRYSGACQSGAGAQVQQSGRGVWAGLSLLVATVYRARRSHRREVTRSS